MNRAASAGARSGGFTLVELLVALAVMLLMVPLAVEALHAGMETWQRVETHAEAWDRTRNVLQLLRRELSRAAPVRDARAPGGYRTLFRGSAGEVVFVTRFPGALAGGGLVQARLHLDDGAGDGALVWSYRALDGADGDAAPMADAQRLVLAEGIAALELAYYGADRPGAEPLWRDRWDSDERLPERVRVRIAPAASGARPWPQIVVPIHAGERSS